MKRRYLTANFPECQECLVWSNTCMPVFGSRLVDDMFLAERQKTSIKGVARLGYMGLLPVKVSCYCAGFPCTPYSTLGTKQGFGDKNARQFLRVVARVRRYRPKET